MRLATKKNLLIYVAIQMQLAYTPHNNLSIVLNTRKLNQIKLKQNGRNRDKTDSKLNKWSVVASCGRYFFFLLLFPSNSLQWKPLIVNRFKISETLINQKSYSSISSSLFDWKYLKYFEYICVPRVFTLVTLVFAKWHFIERKCQNRMTSDEMCANGDTKRFGNKELIKINVLNETNKRL